MSTTIDQRVVEMRFDNKNFEKNTQQTMSTLDKLKQKLNLTGASKGLENIDTQANKINLSGLSNAVDTVRSRFSALEVMGITALANITNSAVNAGKRIVSALTIDPVKTGFSEYETQMNAVQTILANTQSKGTNLDDVNNALDQLNTYADKTIYNFTEMTRNIGTFTAAGVDLDTSVKSIQGIANLAAVSGSSSQQASTAMYQLSQALAAGKVQLMDWNSVVNAGMGGQVFQDALKRTAKNMGKDVDGMIKKYGSFRESLSKGEWLTSDVLTKTLEQFTMAAAEGSEEWNKFKKSLMDEGYTEAQATEILKMANTATDAATKVKTVTQLWDTLKESAQSGWTQTWEILVGDFEEAKELLTGISDVVGNFINKTSQARNDLLQGWKDAGGRTATIEALKNAFEGIGNIIKPISEAFRDIFPPLTVKQLMNFTEKFKELTGNFAAFTEKHGPQIKSTFKGVFSVLDLAATIIAKLVGGFFKITGSLLGFTGGILNGTASLGDFLSKISESVKESNIFGKAIDGVVGFIQNGIEKIKEFTSYLGKKISMPGYEGFLGVLMGIWNFITKVGSNIGQAFAEALRSGDISAGLDVLNTGIFGTILLGIKKFIDNLSGAFNDAKGFLGNIKDILGGVKGVLEAYQQDLKANVLMKIATAIGILAASITILAMLKPDRIDQAVGAMTLLFAELMGSLAIFTKISANIKHTIRASAAIIALSTALLILSAAMKILGSMSWGEIGRALIGTVVGLGALVGAVNLLPNEAKLGGATKAIKKLASSLLVLSIAMKVMGSMSWGEIGRGLTAMVVGLGALVGAMHLLPESTAFKSAGLIGLATSLVVLSGALKIMATMSWMEIGKGLATMAGALTAITLAVNLLPKSTFIKSAGLIGLATSLVILAGALKLMATMSWMEIGKGLTVMGGALLELTIALNLMRGTLAGSAALLIAAGALAILAPVMMLLSTLSWEGIAKGLVALAGAFTIIGVAGLLLTPVIPSILGLAGACALIGVAVLGVGVGLGLMAAGITALSLAIASGTTAIVAGISAIILGIIGLIPNIVAALGEGILVLCDVLIRCAPTIAETLLVVISEVMKSLAVHAPVILDSLMQLFIGLLQSFRDNLPELIVVAVEIIGAFFQGIVEALKGIDTTTLLQGIAGVGLLTGLMYLLSGIAALVPSAMLGVLGMGVLITELALVLAAIGAIAQIPGLSWLIEEGGDFLQKIGTAIGQFIGGIVGGIAEGATSTLPQVGTNLSDFMKNLQPFLDGAKTIDTKLLEGVKTIASIILTLTAANLIESLTSWITGGSSFADFGKDLVEFGKYLKQYSGEVTGIDVAAVNSSASAAKSLVKVADAIPGDGLLGFDGIDNFGKDVVKFGESMKNYSEKVKGLNISAVTTSATAAKTLVEVANAIPDDGTFGGDGIDNFGKDLAKFGESIKKYADNISKVSVKSINSSVTMVRSLISLINDMSGLNTKGVNSFGTAMTKLGQSGFTNFIKAFNSSNSDLTKSVNTLMNNMVNALNSKTESFNKSGVKLMKGFAKGIENHKSKVTSKVKDVTKAGVTAARNYYDKFYSAGSYLVTGFANGISANTYKATAKAQAMASAAEKAARDELKINSPSKVFREIGSGIPEGFAQGITMFGSSIKDSVRDMGATAISNTQNVMSRILDTIGMDMNSQPTIRPVLDLSDIESGAGTINSMLNNTRIGANLSAISYGINARNQNGVNGDVVSAIDKLRKDLGNISGDTYNVNGITYDDGSNITDAVRTLVRAAKIERRV